MTSDRYLKQSNASPERQRSRLEAKIPADRSGCWPWTGQRTTGGYGTMRTGPGQRDYVHRVAYRLYVGPIPDGSQIDHLCRNRACFNPGHLEIVSNRTNFLRGAHPNAIAYRTAMCRKDLHEMTPRNTMVSATTGARRCRECNYAWQRARRSSPKRR